MEHDPRIFVDTNYFVALAHADDTLYAAARSIARMIEKNRSPVIISDLIFLEIATVLSQKRGKPVAREVGAYLRSDPMVRITHIDESLHEDTWRIFHKIEDKNISFVDCSTIALMKAEHITVLLTFDTTDFKKLRREYKFAFFSGK